jgi:radical SAM protein with 4Fe4S-binding SPASM domain
MALSSNPIARLLDSWITDQLATRKLPYPRSLNIEPAGNVCQLRCPLCPTGLQMTGHHQGIMHLDTFRTILDKLPFIQYLELYRSGEPFLNPELFAMIGEANSRKIEVTVSTHFSFSRPDAFFRELASCGLRRLVVSIDGASQDSYAQYRVGGDYDLVLSNLKKAVAARDSTGSKLEIVWQYLVNKFNEGDIDCAGQICRDLKISLDLRPMDLDDELPDIELAESLEERKRHWLPVNPKYIHPRYQGAPRLPLFSGICQDLFTRLVVTADGKVMPCCMVWDKNHQFGDLLTQSFDDIWYGRTYLEARSSFLMKDFTPKTQSVCQQCTNFGKALPLKDKFKLLIAVYRKNVWHAVREYL